jgi:hypothetical protein
MIARSIPKYRFQARKRSNGVLIIFIIIALLFVLSAASSNSNKKLFNDNAQAQVAKR